MNRIGQRAPVLLAFGAVYFIWGTTFAAIAVAVSQIPPFMLAALRWIVAGVVLYGLLRCRGVQPPSAPQWGRALVSGAFLITLANGLVCWAETRMDSGPVATLQAVSPMLIVLMDWLVYGGERPQPRTLFGLVLGFVGVILLVGPTESGVSASVLAVLLAGACWAAGSLVSRHAPRPTSLPMSSAAQMIAGGALLAISSAAMSEPIPATVTAEAWLALLYLVVFGSLLAYGAYVYLVREVSPGALATHAFVNPVIAVAVGVGLLGESVGLRTLLAAGLIVVAVALIVGRPRGRRTVPTAPRKANARGWLHGRLARAGGASRRRMGGSARSGV